MALSARKDEHGRFIVPLWISERGRYSDYVNASASPADKMRKQEIAFSFSYGKFKQTSGYPISSIKNGWRLLEALNQISGKNATIVNNEGNNTIFEKKLSPDNVDREQQRKNVFDIGTELQYAPVTILKSDSLMTKRYKGDKLHGRYRKSAKSFSSKLNMGGLNMGGRKGRNKTRKKRR